MVSAPFLFFGLIYCRNSKRLQIPGPLFQWSICSTYFVKLTKIEFHIWQILDFKQASLDYRQDILYFRQGGLDFRQGGLKFRQGEFDFQKGGLTFQVEQSWFLAGCKTTKSALKLIRTSNQDQRQRGHFQQKCS